MGLGEGLGVLGQGLAAAPKPAQPTTDTSAPPPTAGAPKPGTPAPGTPTTAPTACGTTGGPCGAAPKTAPVTDNSAAPQIAGAPKPAKPTIGAADASVCGTGGPGCDRSVLGVNVRNETAGPPIGRSGLTTSCGPSGSGCAPPAPAAPAPAGSGSPLGPSNAGSGAPGGPGHTGGSGAARLNGAGSNDPSITRLATGAPGHDVLDPNQSPSSARGPPTHGHTNSATDPNAGQGSFSGLFAPGARPNAATADNTSKQQDPLTRLFVPGTPAADSSASATAKPGTTDPRDELQPAATLLGPVPGRAAPAGGTGDLRVSDQPGSGIPHSPWADAFNRADNQNAGQLAPGPETWSHNLGQRFIDGAIDSTYATVKDGTAQTLMSPQAARQESSSRYEPMLHGDFHKFIDDYWNRPGTSLAEDTKPLWSAIPGGNAIGGYTAVAAGNFVGGTAHLGANIINDYGPAAAHIDTPQQAAALGVPGHYGWQQLHEDFHKDPYGVVLEGGSVAVGALTAGAGSAEAGAIGATARGSAAGEAAAGSLARAGTSAADGGAAAATRGAARSSETAAPEATLPTGPPAPPIKPTSPGEAPPGAPSTSGRAGSDPAGTSEPAAPLNRPDAAASTTHNSRPSASDLTGRADTTGAGPGSRQSESFRGGLGPQDNCASCAEAHLNHQPLDRVGPAAPQSQKASPWRHRMESEHGPFEQTDPEHLAQRTAQAPVGSDVVVWSWEHGAEILPDGVSHAVPGTKTPEGMRYYDRDPAGSAEPPANPRAILVKPAHGTPDSAASDVTPLERHPDLVGANSKDPNGERASLTDRAKVWLSDGSEKIADLAKKFGSQDRTGDGEPWPTPAPRSAAKRTDPAGGQAPTRWCVTPGKAPGKPRGICHASTKAAPTPTWPTPQSC